MSDIERSSIPEKVPDTNGGNLSKISCFSAILEALSPALPKLLMSTVCCVYSDDSDTRKFIQVRFPDRGFCSRKTLKLPPFGSGTFFVIISKDEL